MEAGKCVKQPFQKQQKSVENLYVVGASKIAEGIASVKRLLFNAKLLAVVLDCVLNENCTFYLLISETSFVIML